MLTKADFQKVIRDSIDQYPDLAVRFRAQDSIILQHLEAIATMLSMVSQNVELAQSEVFEKTRDATVLADAAMRGIVPKADPAAAEILVSNASTTAVRIETGRALHDSRGNPWIVTSGADIAAGGSEIIRAEQRTRSLITYTVERDEPFHAVEIQTLLDDGQRLSSVSLRDADGEWAYSDRYTNCAAGDRIYHVEADDRQRVYVRFGLRDVVGVQPAVGAVFGLRLDYSHGAISIPVDATFSLDSIQSPADAFIALRLSALPDSGQDPISLDTLRMLAKYPSVYDSNAVYLGEFDFLVRRHFPSLRFLSVWNERVEERVRGATVDNINVLFVACVGESEEEAVAPDDAEHGPVIAEADLTELQRSIRAVIERADDSYRVRFLAPRRQPQAWAIEARIGSAYLPATVAQKIRETILARYGYEAIKRGGFLAPVQDIYSSLRLAIPEVAEPGADIAVVIPPAPALMYPEDWRYIPSDSLTVNVVATNNAPPAWGW